MKHSANFATKLDHTDEDILYELSDETLEAAAGIEGVSIVTVGPTIIVGGLLTWGVMPRGRLKAK
jgi:hypothetical protein